MQACQDRTVSQKWTKLPPIHTHPGRTDQPAKDDQQRASRAKRRAQGLFISASALGVHVSMHIGHSNIDVLMPRKYFEYDPGN
jgi:hypothetical protein